LPGYAGKLTCACDKFSLGRIFTVLPEVSGKEKIEPSCRQSQHYPPRREIMKKTLSIAAGIVAASMMMTANVHAEGAHPPEQKTHAASAKAVALPSSEAIRKMQGNVKKMRSQLDLIGRAKTDEERQKLLTEHMQTLHENMMTARGMMSGGACPMMRGGMGMTKGADGEAAGQGMGMDRMQMMEKRMDMMQMKMDTMMKNQSGAVAPVEKPGTP
jgi:hypothetical protein